MAEPRIYTFRSDVNVVGEVYSTKQGRLIGDAPKDPKVGDIALVDGIIKRCTGTDDAGNPTWEDCDPRVGSIQDDLETVSGSVTDNREDIESNKESIKANAESIEACREALEGKLDKCAASVISSNVTGFAWVQDASAETYGFKGTVAIEGVTAKDIAIVSFSTADAAAGTYSSECETYDGGVTIWAKTQPESLTVPSILIVKG